MITGRAAVKLSRLPCHPRASSGRVGAVGPLGDRVTPAQPDVVAQDLGLGVTPPDAEWGLMLNTLRGSIYVNALVPALPGVAIFLTSMAFNLLSDGLRDAMEVRA